MKPTPDPVDPGEVRALALKLIAESRYCQMATIDGDQPRVRPVSPVRTDGFEIYIANLRMYHKTVELEANPRVELCYMDEHHNQVRITGTANTVTDEALLRDIHAHHNLLRQFIPDPLDPNLIIYHVVPDRVRYMQEWALKYLDVAISD